MRWRRASSPCTFSNALIICLSVIVRSSFSFLLDIEEVVGRDDLFDGVSWESRESDCVWYL